MRKPITVERVNIEKPSNSRVSVLSIYQRGRLKIAKCKCSCGNLFDTAANHILYGFSLSCGCLKKENSTKFSKSIEEINQLKPKNSFLTAIERSETKNKLNRSIYIKCRCICGNYKNFVASVIISGRVISCGCAKMMGKEYFISNNRSIYNSWLSMMNRCYYKKDIAYLRYGGRGVAVCDEWKKFKTFLKWSLENGWNKGLQLDKDINGDGLLYSPETCKWVTAKENNRNRRKSRYYEIDGVRMCLSEICEKLNIDYQRTHKRLQSGISFENSIFPGRLNRNHFK